MSLRVYISEFPEYDEFPSKGSHSYGDEIELKDKEFRKMKKYIIENLEIC